MEQLQDLMNNIAEWSDKTFGSDFDRRLGMIAHLRKEVDELQQDVYEKDCIGIQAELADCLMLLLDIAQHTGISANLLIKEAESKLRVNKRRKWGKANPDGSIEHI